VLTGFELKMMGPQKSRPLKMIPAGIERTSKIYYYKKIFSKQCG
jgi:hypothetical protein